MNKDFVGNAPCWWETTMNKTETTKKFLEQIALMRRCLPDEMDSVRIGFCNAVGCEECVLGKSKTTEKTMTYGECRDYAIKLAEMNPEPVDDSTPAVEVKKDKTKIITTEEKVKRNCDKFWDEKTAREHFLGSEWQEEWDPTMYKLETFPRDVLIKYIEWLFEHPESV